MSNWELGQKKELYFWFEPTWHVGCATGVVLGSRQAQVEDKDAHAQLDVLAAQLNGHTIESADLDSITHDIQLRFSGGYWLRTFAADPADEESWYIRDNGKQLGRGSEPEELLRQRRRAIRSARQKIAGDESPYQRR